MRWPLVALDGRGFMVPWRFSLSWLPGLFRLVTRRDWPAGGRPQQLRSSARRGSRHTRRLLAGDPNATSRQPGTIKD
jgi:hypothetical protein